MGFSKTETVKAIAEKLGCSKSDIYWHYSTRSKWQSEFFDYTDRAGLFDMAVSRLNYIYREATFQYFRDDNSRFIRGAGDGNCILCKWRYLPQTPFFSFAF